MFSLSCYLLATDSVLLSSPSSPSSSNHHLNLAEINCHFLPSLLSSWGSLPSTGWRYSTSAEAPPPPPGSTHTHCAGSGCSHIPRTPQTHICNCAKTLPKPNVEQHVEGGLSKISPCLNPETMSDGPASGPAAVSLWRMASCESEPEDQQLL